MLAGTSKRYKRHFYWIAEKSSRKLDRTSIEPEGGMPAMSHSSYKPTSTADGSSILLVQGGTLSTLSSPSDHISAAASPNVTRCSAGTTRDTSRHGKLRPYEVATGVPLATLDHRGWYIMHKTRLEVMVIPTLISVA